MLSPTWRNKILCVVSVSGAVYGEWEIEEPGGL
jgi:hypothetical protein